MSAEPLAQHHTLRQLAGRVRARLALRHLRRGLLAAFCGAAVLVVVGRLAESSVWPALTVGWCIFAVGAALTLAIVRAPGDWAVASAADSLGLAERVTSALFAARSDAPVAELVALDARGALDGLDASRYALVESPRSWLVVAVAGGVLALLLLVPVPNVGREADRLDSQRVAGAQQRVQALELQSPTDVARKTDLDARTQQELQSLHDALSRSGNSQEAAHALEQSQQQLSRLPGSDDYAARRSADSVAQALESQPDDVLIPLSQALRAHDDQAVQQALSDLSNRTLSDADKVALQSAANAVAATQPQLAGALRRAATSPAGLSDNDLQNQLAQDAADAAALDRLDQMLANLGQLRAATLPAGATLVPATGTPTAYALVSGTPPANATPIGLGLSAGEQNGSRGPGAENGQAGGGASPNGSTRYDPVYAPTHLGGEPGPQVQIDGDASQARGASVDLPQGPVSAGDERPYDQVYSQYAQAARQSAARQSLPPNVQGLVDRYFGAIAPTPGASSP